MEGIVSEGRREVGERWNDEKLYKSRSDEGDGEGRRELSHHQ